MRIVVSIHPLCRGSAAVAKIFGNHPYVPSPIIPLLESRPEIYKALFRASSERIIIPSADVTDSFDAATPSIHVHIIGQRHMINAFKGSQIRFFGEKPMVPGVNEVKQFIRSNKIDPVELDDAKMIVDSPRFDFGLVPAKTVGQNAIPLRPDVMSDNDNTARLVAA